LIACTGWRRLIMNKVEAHSLAIKTRLKLGLQSTEFVDVAKAASALSVTIVRRPLESDISGATLKTASEVKVILINSSKTVGHQHFTVAHELYHCLYDTAMLNRTCLAEVFSKSNSVEQHADLFATYFLLPEDGIYHQLGLRAKYGDNIEIADIVNLDQFFGVSRKAMCWRLEELKLISRQQGTEFSQNVIHSAKILGKEVVLYLSSNDQGIISDYAEVAYSLLQKGLITQSRYEELLADANLTESILDDGGNRIAD